MLLTFRTTVLWLVVAGAGLLHSGQLRAEPPNWGEMKEAPILMRRHHLHLGNYGQISNPYQPTDGIWRLEPEGGGIRLLRPFTASTVPPSSTSSHFVGDHGFLTIRGDRVLFQAYPYDIHFDAFSWKMLNRLPAANGEATGWALQGPFLDGTAVEATGLQPGVHGLARCVLDIMTRNPGGAVPCEEITVPGTLSPTDSTDERVLLHAPSSPGIIELSAPLFSFPDASWDGDRVLLSFDPRRGGFWRGTELNAHFYPVEGGELMPPTLDLDLDSLPFGLEPENGYLSALHYHPPAGLLFGVLFRRPFSNTSRLSLLFSLDPVTGQANEFSGLFNEDFPPFTFASFGPAPETHEQIIPIVANARGRHDGRWRTDLWLYNPSNEATSLTVTRLTRPDQVLELELDAHASVHVEDILLALGGGGVGDGTIHDALLVASDYHWAEQTVAFGRIWTVDPLTGGAFGHAVPSVPAPFGYSNHSVNVPRTIDPDVPRFNVGANSLAAHIDLDMREPGRFRHNLGVVNPTDDEVAVQLAWTFQDPYQSFEEFGPDVEGFRRKTIVVPPRELRVINIEGAFPAEVVEGWVPRIAVFGVKPVIIWHTMVDNLTGDATFVPFTSLSADTAEMNPGSSLRSLEDYRLAIPVAASNPGVDEARWKTDLYGYVDGNYSLPRIVAAFHPGQSGRCAEAPSGEISQFLKGVLAMPVDRWLETIEQHPQIPPTYGKLGAWGTVYPDVVRSFPECADAHNVKGGLEILAGSWFSGFSRTYTTRSDGGTYGGMLPLYPHGGWPVQHFAGLEGSPDSRINVGFFNGNREHAITHRVSLYNVDGHLVVQRLLTLDPLASQQRELKTFFNLDALPDGTYGLTVMPLDDPVAGVQGRSWAYVSVIDNRTNDPTNIW